MQYIKTLIRNKKIIILSVPIFTFMFYILTSPNESASAVKFGLTVCGEIVIPSIFPFTFLCILIYSTNISKIIEYILSPLKKIGLNSTIGLVIIMSMIGGYPIGSKLISILKKEEIIDDKTANKMLMFCINPGPAFVIIAVGSGMLRSHKAGVILFASTTLSSIVIGIIILSVFNVNSNLLKRKHIAFSEGVVKSISEATSTVINICSFVIIFTCIGSAIKYILPDNISNCFISLLEVTNGCLYLSKYSIYFVAFIISFSGLAVHFQVFSICRHIKINYSLFYLCRIIHSILTVFITYVLEKIFPIYIDTSSFGEIKKTLEISATSVCSLCLICLSFIIMCYWMLSLKEIETQKKNAL